MSYEFRTMARWIKAHGICSPRKGPTNLPSRRRGVDSQASRFGEHLSSQRFIHLTPNFKDKSIRLVYGRGASTCPVILYGVRSGCDICESGSGKGL